MVRSPKRIEDRSACDRETFEREIVARAQPVVLRGLVKDWPAVHAAARSPAEASEYLKRFYNKTPVTIMTGPPAIKGRLFYTEDFRALNFSVVQANFVAALDRLLAHLNDGAPPAIYMGAASVANFLPGFMGENSIALVDESLAPNLWLGNRIIVGPHNDTPDNIACVVAGRRRFRLFPPEQLSNLYVGPLELNPAGRPVSFVSVDEPELERYPRYREALAASQEAELEPGDALYIPSFWWHSVQSLESFNVLVNYWWSVSAKDAGAGEACMAHALLAIADLPERQRRAWRVLFDHYVFKLDGDPVAHVPPEARGWLGARTADMTDALRNYIRQWLNK